MEQWMSIVEYARTYSISDMTVRRRIKTGRLRAVLREGKYYIPVHEVGPPSLDSDDRAESILERHEVPSPPRQYTTPTRAIVKAHPTPKASFVEPSYRKQAPVAAPMSTRPAMQTEFVPPQIRASLATNGQSTVETQTLLAFCDNALKKLGEAEEKLEGHYKTKISQLEAQIKARDLEITHLFQQVEDLQVLVKILEKKQK